MSRLNKLNTGVLATTKVKAPDTINRQGHAAYALGDELRLLSMLNSLKLETQYYRSTDKAMVELVELVEKVARKDPYLAAQCIVWSRWEGEGMRTTSHVAAAALASYISGKEWAKRFYNAYDKKNKRGGCICRPDDMSEIKIAYFSMNAPHKLSMAMKKGFKSYIESLPPYQMFKYKKPVIDISNLVHPNPNVTQDITVDNRKVKSLTALMTGMHIAANTWEARQSAAGQEIAEQVRKGELTAQEAELALDKAKSENWNDLLLKDNLGILAALRNIRNILKTANINSIKKLCSMLEDVKRIREGNIMPMQIDTAYDIVSSEFATTETGKMIMRSLLKGYELSVANLGSALPGKNLVILDCSGSMAWNNIYNNRTGITSRNKTCLDAASLVAATILKATGGDLIMFGSGAKEGSYNPMKNVFDIARDLRVCNMGGTNLATAFGLVAKNWNNIQYDRIFILSDNECNSGNNLVAYKNLLSKCGASHLPYIYSVDMAAYGTTPIKHDGRVNYYYGFGYAMFDDVAKLEFNPEAHIDKVKQIVI